MGGGIAAEIDGAGALGTNAGAAGLDLRGNVSCKILRNFYVATKVGLSRLTRRPSFHACEEAHKQASLGLQRRHSHPRSLKANLQETALSCELTTEQV